MYLEMMEMIKGKRTKRQRPVSPLSLAVTSSLCDGDLDSFDERERISSNMVSASSSSEFAESVGEEEDMANCLILLANSHHQTRKLLEPSGITSNTKESSLCAYECKTCNRRFPSFQALGGHRASHKKPNKGSHEEKKAVGPVGSVMEQEQEEDQFNKMSTILSLHIPNRVVCNNSITNTIKTNKVHECSICGAEFSSGQALGGHMRRHRAFTSTSTTNMSLVSSSPESHESKKPRNSLDLDLNLPAPEDDLQDDKFHFSSKEHVLVFNMSSLVDCHY